MGVLEVRREGAVAILTLNRPERRNALNHECWAELKRTALQLADRPPRALIVTGNGGHFCAGMDLSPDNDLFVRLTPKAKAKDGTAVSELITELKAALLQISKINCPVIAAIEGACAGSGLELALACDLRVAANDAWFSLPETKVGLVPDVGGTVRLTRLIGQSRATEMILTGRRVDAIEANMLGIVNRLCDPGSSLDEARQMASEIAEGGPMATRQALIVLRAIPGMPEDQAMAFETNAGARAAMSGEFFEGLAAFNGKRAPRWPDAS